MSPGRTNPNICRRPSGRMRKRQAHPPTIPMIPLTGFPSSSIRAPAANEHFRARAFSRKPISSGAREVKSANIACVRSPPRCVPQTNSWLVTRNSLSQAHNSPILQDAASTPDAKSKRVATTTITTPHEIRNLHLEQRILVSGWAQRLAAGPGDRMSTAPDTGATEGCRRHSTDRKLAASFAA